MNNIISICCHCLQLHNLQPPPLINATKTDQKLKFHVINLLQTFLFFKSNSLQAVYNVICYDDNPRLRTGMELLRTTKEIESQVHKVSYFLT